MQLRFANLPEARSGGAEPKTNNTTIPSQATSFHQPLPHEKTIVLRLLISPIFKTQTETRPPKKKGPVFTEPFTFLLAFSCSPLAYW